MVDGDSMMRSLAIKPAGCLDRGKKLPREVNHQAKMARVFLSCLNFVLMFC